MLHSLIGDQRDRFLTVLLPLLTKLDYHSLLLPILTDVVGDLVLASPDGSVVRANLHEAHQSAVIEIKEEVVAVQLFLAMKHGLELLFGKDRPVPREDVAVISGIRIPCAADIPSYFMGISPSDLKTNRLVHCAQIGPYAIAVVDRRTNRAVKIDTITGILPRDTELLTLRRSVIMNKRDGDRAAHARFFGRLSELVVSFVRTGTGNFRVTGPTDFPWQEFSTKMSFVPGQSQAFSQFVLGINPTPGLVDGLMDLAILHPQRDAALAEDLRAGRLEAASTQLDLSGERANGGGRTYVDLINDALLSTEEKVKLVIEGYIQPVLDNDGGAVDYLGFDPARGEVSVRFLGSCANCPASILSVETLVKPPLLNIPGVHRVTHRTRLRKDDEKRVETVDTNYPTSLSRESESAMREEQNTLVRESFAKVAPIADQAAAIFYARLFEIAPEAKHLFTGDMMEQGKKLMDTLAVAVHHLDNLEAIVPTVHYPIVGEALIWTLGKGLGDDFTPEVKEAWVSVYGALSSVMLAAAGEQPAG